MIYILHQPLFPSESMFNNIHCSTLSIICLLYTSDAADDLLCVDLGGCRVIKKKKRLQNILSLIQPLKQGTSTTANRELQDNKNQSQIHKKSTTGEA